jgi:NAD-dependent dihydropyrimidine dehydrogenase PreA subunit
MMAKKVSHYVTRPGKNLGDPPVTIPVAEDLVTVPGIPARENDVSFFSREYPLENMALEESASADWARKQRNSHSPEALAFFEEHQERMEPIVEWVKHSGELEPTGTPSGEDVTELIRQKARELGYGEVGFTRSNRNYVYQSRKATMKPGLPNAICLALEQDYNKTQSIPSLEAEDTHFGTYFRQGPLTMELTDFIRALGYKVQVSGPTWHYGPMIPMFVEAGLGQLGANGQLLSPHFGSRARLQIIFTNAKVTYDQPIDYGIHQFCQVCQVCVNRCPGRALMPEKVWYRGVEKNKLVFKRCRPVMARYLGCGICMKVCPIQKYGMQSVMEHYVETGEVLGKGTDNLEGYTLPDKGHFGPGELPVFDAKFFQMPHGRTEDWMLLEFRDQLMETQSNNGSSRDAMWNDFRKRVEESLEQRSVSVDMGMDRGI